MLCMCTFSTIRGGRDDCTIIVRKWALVARLKCGVTHVPPQRACDVFDDCFALRRIGADC